MFDQYFNYQVHITCFKSISTNFSFQEFENDGGVRGGGVRVDWFGAVVVSVIKSLMQTV